MTYIEHRLDAIEARIDDLCGLLAEVVERIDKGMCVSEVTTLMPPMDLSLDGLWDQ